jgi:hypothetical protein
MKKILLLVLIFCSILFSSCGEESGTGQVRAAAPAPVDQPSQAKPETQAITADDTQDGIQNVDDFLAGMDKFKSETPVKISGTIESGVPTSMSIMSKYDLKAEDGSGNHVTISFAASGIINPHLTQLETGEQVTVEGILWSWGKDPVLSALVVECRLIE